jgi:hypothetical protein
MRNNYYSLGVQGCAKSGNSFWCSDEINAPDQILLRRAVQKRKINSSTFCSYLFLSTFTIIDHKKEHD